MVETAVGLVIDKLTPFLIEEAYLLKGIHKEVEEIKCDRDYILAFLKDADARAETDQSTNSSHGVKVWMGKLRGAAFEVEDVIDEYTHLMAQQQRQKHRFISFLRRGACLVIKLKPRHDISSKIREVRQTIRDINQRSASFGFNITPQQGSTSSGQTNTWYDPRKDSRILKETEVVGIETARDELVEKLKGGPPRRTVISVVEMGVFGKTTLAHQVCHRVKGHFDCCAWIEVSQSYNEVEIPRNLMKKFCEARKESVPQGNDAMDEIAVTTTLRDYLQGKRYIIFFDDVWNINFWYHIKNALPDDNEKSGRIVITT